MTELTEKQQAILSAAVEEFAQRGLQATTMEAICSAAGVSKRTLYKHYATKEALFDAVVISLIERIQPITTIQFIPNYDFEIQLRHLADSAVSLLADEDYIKLSRIVMIESMRCQAQADRLNHKFSQCEAAMSLWFEEASRAGCLGTFSAPFAAAFFWGALKRLTFWDQAIRWQAPLAEADLDAFVDQACQLFCGGIKYVTQEST
ncbi:TetR/AcrR family transcriptional regulator [Pseudoalteromonas sp. OOF1S-7]|uniref:TetR/AcrR family transcriptional regulator n=1 Tax=Pseudoalteromonas sp. OOF1S-7 TaxID=2917757 RepID=UPI001EF50A28|nr:TetR/AcrR family transcriptional regulator [Pseudoalteromonas sp. OOF1S-7]MCG7534782.1 TetR/AcrR family transcriptional regulator [Pseudoalteromonas sp. OOF1S-7]